MSDVPQIEEIIEESKHWDTATWLAKILEARSEGGDRAMFMRLESCIRLQMQVALAHIEQGLLEEDYHSYRSIVEGLNADINLIVKEVSATTGLKQQFPLIYGILPLMTSASLSMLDSKHEINRKADPKYVYLFMCDVLDFLAEMDSVPLTAIRRSKEDFVRNNPRYRGVQSEVNRQFLKTLKDWLSRTPLAVA